LFVTLTACGSVSNAEPDLAAPAPDPLVERRVETRTVCPDEIYRELPPEPVMAEGGELVWNPAGGEYLDAKVARGEAAEDALLAARAACKAQGAE
jgi:hypothetical protein